MFVGWCRFVVILSLVFCRFYFFNKTLFCFFLFTISFIFFVSGHYNVICYLFHKTKFTLKLQFWVTEKRNNCFKGRQLIDLSVSTFLSKWMIRPSTKRKQQQCLCDPATHMCGCMCEWRLHVCCCYVFSKMRNEVDWNICFLYSLLLCLCTKGNSMTDASDICTYSDIAKICMYVQNIWVIAYEKCLIWYFTRRSGNSL